MSTVAQAQFYFDSLDPSLPHTLQLDYAPTVARFEWPPWALLTGSGKLLMMAQDAVEREWIAPYTVPRPLRSCRFSQVQPFLTCDVHCVICYMQSLCSHCAVTVQSLCSHYTVTIQSLCVQCTVTVCSMHTHYAFNTVDMQ